MSAKEQTQVGLVRLTPVLSAAASLTFAASEYWTMLPWLNPELPSHLLSVWFEDWFRYGATGVVTFATASLVGGYLGWTKTGGRASKLYGYGTLLAAAHFLFAPLIMQCVGRLVHGPTDAKAELRRWLLLHTIRTFTTDIPALICFIGAYLHTV